jgi:hypothetical protein
MKSCIIYKTFKNEYKIVTQSKSIAGYLLAVSPVYILSTSCTDDVLLSTILKALNNSTENVKAPDRNEFPLIQKQMLSDLKEKSFPKLYINSTSCEIRLENKVMNIYPNKLLTEGQPKDGLYWVEEDKIMIEENAVNDTLVLKVREILNRRYY